MRVFGVFLSLNGLLFILCEREKFYYFLFIFFENKYCLIPSEAGLAPSGSPAALVP